MQNAEEQAHLLFRVKKHVQSEDTWTCGDYTLTHLFISSL